MSTETPSLKPRKRVARHLACCLLPHVLFVLLAPGLLEGGLWLALPPLFLLIGVPGLDCVTGWQDDARFEKEDFSPLQLALLHWNTRLYAVFYQASVIWLVGALPGFSPLETGLALTSASLLGGIGFAAAHELLHGKERLDQILQRVLTAFLFYPHYKLIHIRSHHVHAGTGHDENTAWLNETVYGYLRRTIPGSLVRCWQLESRRVGAAFWRNRMLGYGGGQAALLGLLFLLAGLPGLGFYLAHILGAHLVLESVNYIQHYGLMRREFEAGYEKTGPEHSWDTYHFFSSYITFRVGHHSCHHIAVKPYYLLAAEPQAPKLPVGYFWAIALVLLPPWWRRVIHPRLQAEPVPA